MPLHGLHVIFIDIWAKSVDHDKLGQNMYFALVARQNEIKHKIYFQTLSSSIVTYEKHFKMVRMN